MDSDKKIVQEAGVVEVNGILERQISKKTGNPYFRLNYPGGSVFVSVDNGYVAGVEGQLGLFARYKLAVRFGGNGPSFSVVGCVSTDF